MLTRALLSARGASLSATLRPSSALIPVWMVILTALGVVFPRLTAAQDSGTVEVALFGQRTAFDEGTTLAFGTAPGIGGMAGYFVWPNLAVEVGTSFTWTHPAEPPRVGVNWVPLRVQAAYYVPVTETFYPFAGVGFVRNAYSDALDGADNGLSALAGFKTYVDERFAFRAGLHVDRVSTPFNEGEMVNGTNVSSHLNWNLSAGISMDLGPGRFLDDDADGVRNRADVCPNTPPGVSVDAAGCRRDDDGDGVFDEDDRCPLTPPGARVDGAGCRLDADTDGVYDEDDRCPGTPPGVGVDVAGCALDTDEDSVADHLDRCPATPAGAAVDEVGCRIDSDSDGVWEEDDLCPGTAAGIEVDSTGCQILFDDEEEVPLVLEGVTFETASATLTEAARLILDGVAAALVANPEIRVRVNGHTDSTGDRAYNIDLSQRRAESVMTYLASQSVAGDRMEARGFGPDEPVATNETPDGRQANRRVELERIDTGG